MGFSQDLTNLGEDIIGSFNARVNFLGQNCADVKNLKFDAKKLIGKFAREHKAMGKALRANLGGFADDLTGTVDSLRRKFKKHQAETHRECKEAHQGWIRVAKILAGKRRNFKGDLSRAKQKAARTH